MISKPQFHLSLCFTRHMVPHWPSSKRFDVAYSCQGKPFNSPNITVQLTSDPCTLNLLQTSCFYSNPTTGTLSILEQTDLGSPGGLVPPRMSFPVSFFPFKPQPSWKAPLKPLLTEPVQVFPHCCHHPSCVHTHFQGTRSC